MIGALGLIAAVAVIPSSRQSGEVKLDASGAVLAATGLLIGVESEPAP